MKISLKWLQTYFDAQLPSAEEIADAYTFHAFEIEEMQGDMMDVKVLPNRAADCLSHRGLAKELSAILDLPLKNDPLRTSLENVDLRSPHLEVKIEDPEKCLRYMGAVVKGVKVGPSPEWLREALEAVGQRSINNVVDATNYVMLNIGQPLHAFDAVKLVQKDGKYSIGVRSAKADEQITLLSGEKYTLSQNIQLITDANADIPIALAGVKGGKAAELTNETTDLIVESANFDGTTTRRAAQALKLFTDASLRFQNRPSPELAAYGMRDVLALITDIAGGEVTDIVDAYPVRPAIVPVSVTNAQVDSILGSSFSKAEIEDVFKRLALPYMVVNDIFTITPPSERTDLVIPEDLVEEVGRILGYDRIAPLLLEASGTPDQARFRGIEKLKDELIAEGYTEISTQSFTKEGDIYLANPLDKGNPALRKDLTQGVMKAGIAAVHYAPLLLPPNTPVRLFEMGTVFSKDGEYIELLKHEFSPKSLSSTWGHGTAQLFLNDNDVPTDASYVPVQYKLGAYKPFSLYPFIARDIALWTPAGTESEAVMKILRENAGELLVRLDQFDTFEKEGRISYAYRLVFQSSDRTLTDDEVNGIMATITATLIAKGYEVR